MPLNDVEPWILDGDSFGCSAEPNAKFARHLALAHDVA